MQEAVGDVASQVLLARASGARSTCRRWSRGRSAGSRAWNGPLPQRSRGAWPPAARPRAARPGGPLPAARPRAAGTSGGGTGAAGRAAASTSLRWIRPPGPEPWTPARSTPSSCARCRAEGEMRRRSGASATGGAAAGGGRRRLPLLADERQGGADRDLRPGLDQELFEHAGREGLHLHVGLVRVHDGDDVAALDAVTRVLLPLDQRSRAHVGSEGGHEELAHQTSVSRTAAAMESGVGSAASSRCLAYGIGTSAPQTRRTGQSSRSKPSSMIRALTSATSPTLRQPSSTRTTRWVRATEASTVSRSSGRRERRSTTSASTPSSASRSAASRHFPSAPP